MFNKKWVAKRLTVNLAAQEAKKLEKYCAVTGRPMTDVLRQLIRDKL
ncbi:MAG: ribbon-helix-helix protein, CopG family [Mastigocoleus sp. MO_167.B18]|nr:ribbon-helix-helix protein, CopG family [Mastigocoleus sp. MO_188.B34]MDJ0698043.1 ribbon-helix-helix protein, CopG family [Mastigocoleus sp. MO_188.B34]MDJ0772799.1 ribbon-helix-helix protein, CopG family [Mastigocoleus sp. MO_167.B18]